MVGLGGPTYKTSDTMYSASRKRKLSFPLLCSFVGWVSRPVIFCVSRIGSGDPTYKKYGNATSKLVLRACVAAVKCQFARSDDPDFFPCFLATLGFLLLCFFVRWVS